MMKSRHTTRFLALGAAGLTLCLSAAQAGEQCKEVNLEWFDAFTGPGTDWLQQGVDIALDADGNIIVTGNAFLNWFRCGYGTVKYSPDGELLWHHIYLLDPNQNSYAEAVVVDDAGNIYVTGNARETDPAPFSLYKSFSVTLKYAPDGTLLWEHVYAAPPSRYTSPTAMAIDPNGDVVIVGAGQIDGGFQSFALKIDPDGKTLWDHLCYPNGWTVPYALAIDPQGFISVGGTTAEYGLHLLVMRYSPDGALLWHDVTAGFGNIEEVWDVAVDEAGNIYALGQLASAGIGFSYHLMKYSPAGVKQWSKTLTLYGATDYPRTVTIDPEGNIIVCGSSLGSGSKSIFLGKYTPDGDLLWTLGYNAGLLNASADDMVVDQHGNIYTTGNGGDQFLTVKVDPDGNVCWTRIFSYSDAELFVNYGNAIAVNDRGDVFVTGVTWLNFHYYYGTLKYSAPGIVGDLTGDGSVGVADLLILLAAWGPCDDAENCPADLDGDGSVGVGDLLILLANWI